MEGRDFAPSTHFLHYKHLTLSSFDKNMGFRKSTYFWIHYPNRLVNLVQGKHTSNSASKLGDKSLVMMVVESVCVCWWGDVWGGGVSRSVVSDSLQLHRLGPAQLPHPWEFPGKNTRVGCHSLLQGIFPTQGSNPGLLPCRQTLYCLSH